MKDLSYINTGLYTRFVPNTTAGEAAWRVMASQDGCGAILSVHLPQVLAQLRKAGYSVEKAKPCKVNDDELLRELMA